MGSELPKGGADGEIARLAARQHGVVTLEQLKAAGIHRRGITRRLKANRLCRIHRGIYAVGHNGLSREGRWMAAVLACGPDAVLSHLSAGWLWGMLRTRRHPTADPTVEELDGGVSHVLVPGEGKSRKGIKIHRSRTLFPSQVTRRLGIPVTNPSRTLSDLRGTLPPKRFAAALREAEFLELPIDADLGPDGTRSDMEALFLGLCRRHRLPKPEVNVPIGEHDIDFVWRERRLAVEVDGWDSHRTRWAFEEDRARDLKLRLLGYEVVRFTWRQLTDDPAAVAAALRALLARA